MPSNREVELILRLKDEATNTWQKFGAQLEQGVNRMQQQFQRFGGIVAGAFSVIGLEHFVEASNKQELASNQLEQALKNQGVQGDSTRLQMEGFAKALQKTTTFADEDIIKLQAMLVGMTGLRGQALEPLTKAVLDLSIGMNISTEQAVRMIGKTQEGMEGLKRMGITIGETANEEERLAKITEAVSKHFGGLAEAAGTTGAGKIAQFRNQINDLEEKFGDIIKNILSALLPTINKFLEVVGALPIPLLAATLAIGALTAAVITLNAALLTNPIVLSIIGITGAVIGLSAATNLMSQDVGKATGELKINTDGLIAGTKAFDDYSKAHVAFQSNWVMTSAQIAHVNAQFVALGGILEETKTKIAGLTLTQMREQVKELDNALLTLIPGTTEYTEALRKWSVAQHELQDVEEKQKTLSEELFIQYEKHRLGLDKLVGSLDMATIGYKQMSKSILLPMPSIADLEKALSDVNERARNLHGNPEGLKTLGEQARILTGEIEKMKAAMGGGMAAIVFPTDSIAGMNEKLAQLQTELDGLSQKSPKVAELTNQIEELRKKLGEVGESGLEKVAHEIEKWAPIAQNALGLIDQAESQASQANIDRMQAESDKLLKELDRRRTAEVKAIDQKKSADLKAIDLRLKSETLSTEERKKLELDKFNISNQLDAQKQAVDEKYAAEKAATEKRYGDMIRAEKVSAFNQHKAISILESIVNTAVAVTAALRVPGAGLALAVAVGALGAAETAIIASQPVPTFHEGSGNQTIAEVLGKNENDEFPILVKGNETIRTFEQERMIQSMLSTPSMTGGSQSQGFLTPIRSNVDTEDLKKATLEVKDSITVLTSAVKDWEKGMPGQRLYESEPGKPTNQPISTQESIAFAGHPASFFNESNAELTQKYLASQDAPTPFGGGKLTEFGYFKDVESYLDNIRDISKSFSQMKDSFQPQPITSAYDERISGYQGQRGGGGFQPLATPVQNQEINNHYTLNFSGAITTKEAFKKIVQDGMRDLGITDVSLYFKNPRATTVL